MDKYIFLFFIKYENDIEIIQLKTSDNTKIIFFTTIEKTLHPNNIQSVVLKCFLITFRYASL